MSAAAARRDARQDGALIGTSVVLTLDLRDFQAPAQPGDPRVESP
jgi:hypothetical protein